LNWDFSESLYEWRGVSLLGGRVYTLDLWSNALTELPVEITNLSPSQHLFVSNNSLSEENLDPAVVVWLDEYAPDWRDTQNLKQSKSLSIEVKLEFSSSPNEVHHEKFDVFGRKHKN
jgi:Leucine-rich repeat (LRR) protein